jgi:cyclopropane-fatty-acyl-phospholipid synthase
MMSTTTASPLSIPRGAPAAARTALRLMQRLAHGTLTVQLPTGTVLRFGNGELPAATLTLRNWNPCSAALRSGDIGFAESYIAGDWTTSSLTDLLQVFISNRREVEDVVYGSWLGRLAYRVKHLLNRNTKANSQKNIHAHYDLGNAFYGAWLDESMTYSSALFASPSEPLPAAQEAKYAALASSIGLESSHSVLEIGCGWGGFAEFAAGRVGAKVTGITISPSQYEFAKKRMFDQGLADRASIELIDYRDVRGRFDRVASIEMFEAVGEAYWPTYFGKVRDLLAPGGRAGLQIITIKDELFEDYKRQADFIQKYIFPGGMLPSEVRLRQEMDRAGLSWQSVQRFGVDYARTLNEWAVRFQDAWKSIAPLGFDERFRRLWLFYLGYCEAGFRTQRTDVIQVSLGRA